MLLKQFKIKEEQQEANRLLREFNTKGNKEVNINNFIDLNYSYCNFVLEGRCYKGFYSLDEIGNLFKILKYHQGRIKTLNG